MLDVRFLDGRLDTCEKEAWWWAGTAKPDRLDPPLLHYCKFYGGVVLYAEQSGPCQAGFYDHRKYHFVFDPLFMREDNPAGFGYIDVMKMPDRHRQDEPCHG